MMVDLVIGMGCITSKVEICLQADGSWAFFFGNTTICATPYREANTEKIKLRPVRGDSVRYGSWVDLDGDELQRCCKRLEKLAQKEFENVEGAKSMNNCYGSAGDMQMAHIEVQPVHGEAYEVYFPVSDTDDLERQEDEIREWVTDNLAGMDHYRIIR